MGTITFDFDPWDDTEDRLLTRPGNDVGYAVIRAETDIGDMPYSRQHAPDELISESESGAVGVLAGALEFLRSRDYTAEQVESKVKSYIRNNKDRLEQQVLRDKINLKAVVEIANPKSLKLKDTVVTI